MYYAIDENRMRVSIDDASANVRYLCPACGDPLVIKRGKIIAHHFAHKKGKQCDPYYASKTSLWHRTMQNKFPEAAQEMMVWNRNRTKFRVADALVTIDDDIYVFEFQHSTISTDEFIARTTFYLDLGYKVVWIFDFRDSRDQKCLFYEKDSVYGSLKHVVWLGRDRVKLLDSDDIRNFLCDVACNYKNELQVLFHVSTGLGRKYLKQYGNSYQRYMWEYINPFDRQLYYIKPNFYLTDSLADFYAGFYTEDEVNRQIRTWCKK